MGGVKAEKFFFSLFSNVDKCSWLLREDLMVFKLNNFVFSFIMKLSFMCMFCVKLSQNANFICKKSGHFLN